MEDCGTVLVVAGDARTRETIASLAARLGRPTIVSVSRPGLVSELDEAPALALLEVETSAPSGYELLHELQDRFGPVVPVILLSGRRTEALDRVAGLLLGADDYVVTPFDEDELLARMRRSLRRSNGTADGNGARADTSSASLTAREREVLALLARGLGQGEIAERLVVSPKTVSTHIQHLMSKLGVHSRAHAVAEAYRLGLVNGDFEAHALELQPEADGGQPAPPPVVVP